MSRRRIVALMLALTLSLLFVCTAAHLHLHDHSHSNCPVCAMVRRVVLALGFAIPLFLFWRKYSVQICLISCTERARQKETPISLKVKMLN
jgi:hypothetical protein